MAKPYNPREGWTRLDEILAARHYRKKAEVSESIKDFMLELVMTTLPPSKERGILIRKIKRQ